MKHSEVFRSLRADILAKIRESTGISTDLDMLEQLNLHSAPLPSN
jgi:hypothetical protein